MRTKVDEHLQTLYPPPPPHQPTSALCVCVCVCVSSCSVIFDSLQPYGLQPARPFCPQYFPGKNIGMGSHFLLQGIFPSQGLNLSLLCLLHWQVDPIPLCHEGSPQPNVTINFLSLSVQFSSVSQ